MYPFGEDLASPSLVITLLSPFSVNTNNMYPGAPNQKASLVPYFASLHSIYQQILWLYPKNVSQDHPCLSIQFKLLLASLPSFSFFEKKKKTLFYIGVQLINNVVTVSGELQSDSDICIVFFSHLGCYMILSRIPCAVQQVHVVIHLKYSSAFMSIPNSLSFSPTPSPGNHKSLSLRTYSS